jgi:hypothetical protein
VAGFFEWLLGQQSHGKIVLSQIAACPSLGSSTDSISTGGFEGIPYSRIAPPGTIELSFSLDENVSQRVLRRALIVGMPKPKGVVSGLNTPDVGASTKRYCNHQRSFVIDEKSAQTKMLKVFCLREVLNGVPWVVFFCDPKDCVAESEAESALETIAKDPLVLGSIAEGSELSEPRGPYLVKLEIRRETHQR